MGPSSVVTSTIISRVCSAREISTFLASITHPSPSRFAELVTIVVVREFSGDTFYSILVANKERSGVLFGMVDVGSASAEQIHQSLIK